MSETKKGIIKEFMHMQALMHRYQAQNFMNFGPRGNPQRGQGRILTILKMKPEISQRELAYLLDMSKQALAELLNKLEKNGFISRETSEEDRRSVNIKLTEKGAEIASEMDDTPPELLKLFDAFNEEELGNLSVYLKRINDQLETQLTGSMEDFRRPMMERFMRRRNHNFGPDGHPFPGFKGGRFHDR